jgi:hypothetical protein
MLRKPTSRWGADVWGDDKAGWFGTDPRCEPIFAVTDDESRVLGWVWYYADKHNSFPDVLAKELTLDGSETIFLQISYQNGINYKAIKVGRWKFYAWPKGVAVSCTPLQYQVTQSMRVIVTLIWFGSYASRSTRKSGLSAKRRILWWCANHVWHKGDLKTIQIYIWMNTCWLNNYRQAGNCLISTPKVWIQDAIGYIKPKKRWVSSSSHISWWLESKTEG